MSRGAAERASTRQRGRRVDGRLGIEAEVKMIGCQMTIDLFDMKSEDFIDEIELGGASTFFEFAGDADVQLLI